MVHEFLAFFQIPWIAAFTAVFFWWFLTGLILFIVKKVDAKTKSKTGLNELLRNLD